MTAKIKLNAASGGGSFSLQAPSSSSNTRVMTLPDTADGTILTTTNPKAGNILQVVSTTKNSATSSSSSSFADISGMSVTITPSSSSSKIYLTGYFCLGIDDSRFRIYLQILGGNCSNYIGATATGFECANIVRLDPANHANHQQSGTLMFLDSPATTSAITYKPQWAVQSSQTAYLNRDSTNDADGGRTCSTFTAMEVAG